MKFNIFAMPKALFAFVVGFLVAWIIGKFLNIILTVFNGDSLVTLFDLGTITGIIWTGYIIFSTLAVLGYPIWMVMEE